MAAAGSGLTAPAVTAEPVRSHASLLAAVRPAAPRPVDVVAVPAYRPASALVRTHALAAGLGARLLVLCSGQADVADALADPAGGLTTGVDLPSGYSHPWLDFATSRATDVASARLGDLATKRNLALLIARMVGWRTVLFLDDDVTVTCSAVRRATRLLGRASAVGLTVTDFPDNSVVGHAHRLAGGRQEVFVSGSTLLVDLTYATGFFPGVYNEDWLFLADPLVSGAVARHGTARQEPYDPFADPARAAGEEFGDVLAEGLMELVRRARGACWLAAGEPSWWVRALETRRRSIEWSAERLADRTGEPGDGAVRALAAAEARRASISAAELAAYVRTWRADLRRWWARELDLPWSADVGSALRSLGLVGQTVRPTRRPNGSDARAGVRDPVRSVGHG
jgi:hypothetical protein